MKKKCDIIIIEREVRVMKNLLRIIVWFVVINFAVCNNIWKEPVSYWWIIEIVVLGISILMVDKNHQ